MLQLQLTIISLKGKLWTIAHRSSIFQLTKSHHLTKHQLWTLGRNHIHSQFLEVEMQENLVKFDTYHLVSKDPIPAITYQCKYRWWNMTSHRKIRGCYLCTQHKYIMFIIRRLVSTIWHLLPVVDTILVIQWKQLTTSIYVLRWIIGLGQIVMMYCYALCLDR